MPFQQGKKNINWKGNKISYDGIHAWLISTFGKANKCEFCRTKKAKKYEYALLKEKRYQRKRANYIQLCSSCHISYDYTKERILKWNSKMSIWRNNLTLKEKQKIAKDISLRIKLYIQKYGHNKPMLGKKHTEKSKDKMRLAYKLRIKK